MTRNRAKKRLRYYWRIFRKYGNSVDLIKTIDKLQNKKFTSLPRRIRHRMHQTGKHLCDWLVYTADVVAFYKSHSGADVENFSYNEMNDEREEQE